MSKKIKHFFKKLIVCLLVQVFLSSDLVFAQGSCLSPALNIPAENFSKDFNAYFSEQAVILTYPDTINARKGFANDLYDLPFKLLFPQVIQYQLLNAVKRGLLNGISRDEIADIQVKYASEDHAYELFKIQGETKLNDLIGNEKLKQYLLPVKQTRDRERIALEGYNPPSKYRAKPEAIEKYKRNWLLNAIPVFTGYTKKELKAKSTGALWIIYFQYKLPYEFGQRLSRTVKEGESAEFKVNIRFKQGTDLEALIVIRGDKYAATVKQPNGLQFKTKELTALVAGFKPVTFEQRIENIEDDNFRQQMHTLQSQNEDLKNVVSSLEILKRVKNVDLADLRNVDLDKVRQDLTEIDSWLAKTPEYFNDRKQEKYQAHQMLERIIKKRGSLVYGNFTVTIDNLEQAINFLEARAIFLFKGISNRNILLYKYAVEAKDRYFYSEVIKNELNMAQAAVSIELFSIALSKIGDLENRVLFQGELFQNKPVIEAIGLIRRKLDKADKARSAIEAITLIDQVEIDKSQKIYNIVTDLKSARTWLESKNFTFYAATLNPIIAILEAANQPGVSFYQVLERSINGIDRLTQNIKTSKSVSINPGFKQMVAIKLNQPKIMLESLLRKVSLRNKAIKKVLADVKIKNIRQAKELLDYQFQQKSGYDSYEHMQADLIEQIRQVSRALDEAQNGFTRSHDFVRVGELIPQMIMRLQKPVYEQHLVGQAI